MKKIFLFISIVAVLADTGCKKFVDVNTDPNRPLDVSEKLMLGPIEFNIANALNAGNEGSAAAYTNHFMQMVCYNQVALNYGTYVFVNTNLNATWGTVYTTCLENLKLLQTKSQKNGNSNYTAVAEILSAYALGFATDLWGDIPYTKAFQGLGNFTPAYDKQEDIYKAIQTLLDQAVVDIDKKTPLKPGTEDFFYTGDMTKWRKLAFSLKARYYMHLTKAPGYTAVAQANLALTALANGMTGMADELKFIYPGGATSQNVWYANMLPASTLVASSAIVDTLVGRSDPRLHFLIAPAKNTGKDTGRVIGTAAIGTLNNFSLLGPAYCSIGSTGYIMPYTEVQFLQAEATLITTGFAAAQPFYQAGISTHMTKLGVPAGSITTYLGTRGTLTASNALEMIMQEKKIADFLSPENYNDWRRTGFPKLTIVQNAQVATIPRRLLYPQTEINANPQPQQSATLTDRVWWDAP